MNTKILKYISTFALLVFPFVLIKKLSFPASFTHVMFMFSIIEILAFLFLFNAIRKGELVLKKNWIIIALIVYLGVIVLTAIAGSNFGYSFWGNYSRMTGIITWLHYAGFFVILSSAMQAKKDWLLVFRALSVSSFFLVLVSFLGRDGFALPIFSFLSQGGSFLGNTSYAGAYELIVFFISMIGLSLEKNKWWRISYIVSLVTVFFNPDLFNFGLLSGYIPFKEAFKHPQLFLGVARASSLVLWGGLVVSGIIGLFHRIKNKKTTIILSLSSLVLIVIVYIGVFSSLMSFGSKLNRTYTEFDPIRPIVWNAAVEGFKDRPVLGYGNDNFFYVYQKGLDAQMINLEDPPWFDRSHNIVLEEVIGHGILGMVMLLVLFVLVIHQCLKLYAKDRKFYFLLIPFIFLFHFIQTQTFFQIDSTLLLMFILLAFLVSHSDNKHFKIKISQEWKYAGQIITGAVVITIFVFSVVMPVTENRLLYKIGRSQARRERVAMVEKLVHLKTDPFETVRQLTLTFSESTSRQAVEIERAGFSKNVAEEYLLYLDIYEHYYPKYQDHYRYLAEYANFINSAFIFGIDELEKGNELAQQAIAISDKYPYPYWILAINSYYQGNNDEALAYAKQALEIDPEIEVSQSLYGGLDAQIRSRSTEKAFMYLPSL